jgi:hypothetical protein
MADGVSRDLITDSDLDELQAHWSWVPPEPVERKKPPRCEVYFMTCREVAKVLGISHQRVEQIEKSALRKVRRALEAEGLDIDDFLAG